MTTRLKRLARSSFVLVLACAHPESVFASTGGSLPWSSPLETLANYASGPFVRIGVSIITVLLVLGFIAAEERMPKWLSMVGRWVVGGVVLGTLTTWALPFLGISSGALLP